jgi:hypothetical protein
VPLRRVHIRWPWRGTPTVVGGGAVGNHGGVAGGVATAVSTIVAVLAVITAVATVVVPMSVVVAAVTVARAVVVVLARRARRRQRRRQWSGQYFVGVERRRSSSWTRGVQVDFLHHGIRLDVEAGDDGVDVRQRSGHGLCGRERRGSGDQLLSGGLPFEIGGGGLLLLKELTGGQDATTRGGGLLLGSFDSDDQGVEPLLKDLDVGGRKGDDVRWHDDRRRGWGREQLMGCSAVKHCSTMTGL